MPEVFVVLIILYSGIGDVGITSSEVTGCPPKEAFIELMEDRKKLGDFKEWAAYCFPVQFFKESGTGV